MRFSRIFLLIVPLMVSVSCTAKDTPPAAEPFVVVAGEDGVALTNGHWLEKVAEATPNEGWEPGPLAVALPDGSAAIVRNDSVTLAKPHTAAVSKECAECAGVAVINGEIVTTRKNGQPGNGFDFVFFDAKLAASQVVPASRLPEEVTTDYPPENTESPVTLAASGDRITVAYLARDGGARRGPSIIAQYSPTGQLLKSIRVNGILRTSAVSPDGAFLAAGFGGSGGWCVTSAELAVVALDRLEALNLGPALPKFFTAGGSAWSLITDLVWRDGKVVATSLLYALGPREDCDFTPQPWTRSVDPRTSDVVDTPGTTELAARRIGPACGDLLSVVLRPSKPDAQGTTELVASVGGTPRSLGRYEDIVLSLPSPEGC
ncbi:hypothetical protein [Catelliglobosispora koreensis]|uniref:hypothetical protein n=1 Tax=Catelliglobosispora koreensis TaxID=129052 RepID=UPI0003613804|nr:hypothetical protein [Catelliglobosispora koreensis]